MTLDDIAKQIDAMRGDMTAVSGKLTDLEKTMGEGFAASRKRDDDLEKTMGEGFAASRKRDDDLEKTMGEGFAASRKRDDDLEKTMTEGFGASRIRDEELRDLTKFGLEARDVLRDEVMRRFDDADRKQDEQIGLLKAAVQHGVAKQQAS